MRIRVNCQNLGSLHRTKQKLTWWFDSQILFCKKAGSVGVNAVKHYLRRLWLVSIATTLSKTFKIQFIFLSTIPHNWSFSTIFKQTFWSILGYHLNKAHVHTMSLRPWQIGALSKLTYINDNCGYRCANPWRTVTGFPKIAASSLDKRHINQRQSLRSLMTILMRLVWAVWIYFRFQQSRRRLFIQV